VQHTPAREREQRDPDPPPRVDPPQSPDPSLHIDIQIHIPSDASPEQIESIFASMAKHLYRRS
jgi:glycine cleavage system regulatory protein